MVKNLTFKKILKYAVGHFDTC